MSDHDREFWHPCQARRGEAVGVILAMIGLVILAAGSILAAVV